MEAGEIKNAEDYFTYIGEVAKEIAEDAAWRVVCEQEEKPDFQNIKKMIEDKDLIHENIDGDAIIIYGYGHNLILEHTNNEDYGEKQFGWSAIVADSRYGFNKNVAFWAFYGDVKDYLGGAIHDVETGEVQ